MAKRTNPKTHPVTWHLRKQVTDRRYERETIKAELPTVVLDSYLDEGGPVELIYCKRHLEEALRLFKSSSER